MYVSYDCVMLCFVCGLLQMEYGVRQLIPELGCAGTMRVVVDTSGVHIGAVLRTRGVFQKMGHIMDRMYPCRLQVTDDWMSG